MKTKQDRIDTVYGGGRHVVILGAGASIAATRRNPEVNGLQLPSMADFIDVVGLRDVVETIPEQLRAENFEDLYSNLYEADPYSDAILEIEARVRTYFSGMSLPDAPTIYDHLVLSLRSKDLIATFNWDPFLYQAWCRNSEVGDLPHISFLHGCVALGYSEEDKRSGPAGMQFRADGGYFEPTRLLYPVRQKNYNDDEFIRLEWNTVKTWLHSEDTKRVTIFGYGAPVSDAEAVQLLNDAWGTHDERNMEQFEIIDVRPEDVVRENWGGFIHSHHYDYATSYFNSSLAHNPRRTYESYTQHIQPLTIAEAFSESNPIPLNITTLKELQEWHRPLIEAEEKANAKK